MGCGVGGARWGPAAGQGNPWGWGEGALRVVVGAGERSDLSRGVLPMGAGGCRLDLYLEGPPSIVPQAAAGMRRNGAERPQG